MLTVKEKKIKEINKKKEGKIRLILKAKEKKKRRVEKEKNKKKEQIFRVAIRLFSNKGFENIMVADITKAAKVAYGTFYNFFQKKEDVLLYFFDKETNNSKEEIDSKIYSFNNFADQVDLLLATYWKHIMRSKEFAKILAQERIMKWGTGKNKNEQEFLSLVAQLIDKDRERKKIKKDFDSLRIAQIIMAVNTMYMIFWLNGTIKKREECLQKMRGDIRLILDGVFTDNVNTQSTEELKNPSN
jgi:AcrR family transcriptional regulator